MQLIETLGSVAKTKILFLEIIMSNANKPACPAKAQLEAKGSIHFSLQLDIVMVA